MRPRRLGASCVVVRREADHMKQKRQGPSLALNTWRRAWSTAAGSASPFQTPPKRCRDQSADLQISRLTHCHTRRYGAAIDVALRLRRWLCASLVEKGLARCMLSALDRAPHVDLPPCLAPPGSGIRSPWGSAARRLGAEPCLQQPEHQGTGASFIAILCGPSVFRSSLLQ